eukprot:9473622-Pyramimonas_sp.AAC.2
MVGEMNSRAMRWLNKCPCRALLAFRAGAQGSGVGGCWGVVWPGEDAQRASAPTTDCESSRTARQGGYQTFLAAPVTINGDMLKNPRS